MFVSCSCRMDEQAKMAACPQQAGHHFQIISLKTRSLSTTSRSSLSKNVLKNKMADILQLIEVIISNIIL